MTSASDEFAVTTDQLACWLESGAPVVVLDVRRQPAFEKNPALITGSLRVPPDQVQGWASNNCNLAGTTVVAYCVYGHEVSQGAAAELRAHGFAAKYLTGGISDWQAQGRSTSRDDA